MILYPIMINGTTIGAVTARRLEKLSPNREVYDYEWEVDLNKGDDLRPAFRAKGRLTHAYNDGPLVLLAKILEEAKV